MPSPSHKTFLEESTAAYYKAMKGSPAVEYLSIQRGLSGDSAMRFRLGYVANPLPGHERYKGMLSIPYLTPSGVTSLRFRRLADGEGPKYLSVPGDEPRVFNTAALLKAGSTITICEGEIDAITADQAGIPAVGFAGVAAWRGHFARCFKGYATVYVLADADDKGQGYEFAEKIAGQVDNVRIVTMPAGHDVNSYVMESGPQALHELVKEEKK